MTILTIKNANKQDNNNIDFFTHFSEKKHTTKQKYQEQLL